mmetsp:Transcript_21540/g.56176  ORF Transcript_21540/g.56176 Transcript_21540/m.56176 type:complete len:218 (+) Transcript_21540:129-782(+)
MAAPGRLVHRHAKPSAFMPRAVCYAADSGCQSFANSDRQFLLDHEQQGSRENALADFELHSMVEAAEPLVIVDPAHSVRRALVLDAGNGVRSGGLQPRLDQLHWVGHHRCAQLGQCTHHKDLRRAVRGPLCDSPPPDLGLRKPSPKPFVDDVLDGWVGHHEQGWDNAFPESQDASFIVNLLGHGEGSFMALLGLLRLHAGDKHPERIGKQHIAAAGG